MAKTRLSGITTDLRIIGYSDFEQAVLRDMNMIAKLNSITELRKDQTYRAAMTMPNIVAFVKGHPDLGIELEGPPGNESLVFESHPQQRWKLLRLLDDQFVRSIITELQYEANSKTRLP